MEIYDLPDRIQSENHKDAQWGQENNAATKREFQCRDRKYFLTIRNYTTIEYNNKWKIHKVSA